MAELPKKVRLGALEWAIESPVDQLHVEQNYGCTQHFKLVVDIDNTQPLQRQQSTLLHELIHAGTDQLLTPEGHLSEQQVKAVVETIMGALRLNPEVTAFLLEEG